MEIYNIYHLLEPSNVLIVSRRDDALCNDSTPQLEQALIRNDRRYQKVTSLYLEVPEMILPKIDLREALKAFH
jgi:hypothetical protein